MGSGGRAVGIEHIDELVKKSIENVKHDSSELVDSGQVIFAGG